MLQKFIVPQQQKLIVICHTYAKMIKMIYPNCFITIPMKLKIYVEHVVMVMRQHFLRQLKVWLQITI